MASLADAATDDGATLNRCCPMCGNCYLNCAIQNFPRGFLSMLNRPFVGNFSELDEWPALRRQAICDALKYWRMLTL